ncbi:hypothetical protein K0M31_020211 [Melipona bicolor]|uniref:Uncharacterized protein n=1 Tax=Melipona bicolor TaxID=60889 RepID=A0AA40G110_9HYME|nr:hypothetical protein K0M31_020211 [Melipona bicolor]
MNPPGGRETRRDETRRAAEAKRSEVNEVIRGVSSSSSSSWRCARFPESSLPFRLLDIGKKQQQAGRQAGRQGRKEGRKEGRKRQRAGKDSRIGGGRSASRDLFTGNCGSVNAARITEERPTDA